MVLRRRAQELWLTTPQFTQYRRDTRLFVLGPLVMNGILGRSSNCLRRGGTLLVGQGRDIDRLAPTDIYGLPAHVERMLSQLPAGYVAPRVMGVGSGGGIASPALRERVQAIFGSRMDNRYATNETQTICDEMDGQGLGIVAAGVDVRILDAQGQPVPPGQEGQVAVRTPAMADGYLALPQETAEVFRDGWFVTSDVGALVGRRWLRLAGRSDDLVNLGGLKVPALQLEQRLCEQPAIANAAVLAVNVEAVSVGVALVLAPGATQEEALAQMQQALQVTGSVRVLFVGELPRMEATGKLDRMGLLRAFRGG
jgi:acyl-coenzyme A synthetase/AMP-(fatty) acid ligase